MTCHILYDKHLHLITYPLQSNNTGQRVYFYEWIKKDVMSTAIIIAIYLLSPIIIAIGFQRYPLVQKIGTVIVAYAIGIILALTGFVKTADVQVLDSVQNVIMNVSVPLAIPLMLFSCDFKLWTRSLPKTILALAGGLLSIITAIIVAFFLFRDSGIGGLDRIAGLMTGIYTGGTLNFFALGSALRVDDSVLLLVYAFEMLVTFPFLMFIVAGGFKIFRKLLPFPDESVATPNNSKIDSGVENYGGMLAHGVLGKSLLGLLLSVAFLAIGAGISLLTTGVLNELVIILTITTLATIASFSEKIRNLPKTFETGMLFILLFSVVVASRFDISCLNSSSLMLMAFVFFIMLTTILLHLLLCRLFHVSGDLFTVANIGLLCSPPFIPPVVGAMRNRKVLISGIVIGLAGYAVGTYLGVGVAWLLKLF